MKLVTGYAKELFVDKHAVQFLKMLAVNCENPLKIRLWYSAGDASPVLYLAHSKGENTATELDTYHLFSSRRDEILLNLFGLHKEAGISHLELEWEMGEIGQLQVTYSLSVENLDDEPTGFKAIKAIKLGE